MNGSIYRIRGVVHDDPDEVASLFLGDSLACVRVRVSNEQVGVHRSTHSAGTESTAV